MRRCAICGLQWRRGETQPGSSLRHSNDCAVGQDRTTVGRFPGFGKVYVRSTKTVLGSWGYCTECHSVCMIRMALDARLELALARINLVGNDEPGERRFETAPRRANGVFKKVENRGLIGGQGKQGGSGPETSLAGWGWHFTPSWKSPSPHLCGDHPQAPGNDWRSDFGGRREGAGWRRWRASERFLAGPLKLVLLTPQSRLSPFSLFVFEIAH